APMHALTEQTSPSLCKSEGLLALGHLESGWVNGMVEKLKFYDLKAKQYFETDNYEVVVKETKRGKIKIAFATSPYTGKKIARILGPVKE
ncbi:MAG: hypothetical protein QXQ91_01210, partial [Nanopusillaceae archaeon]